MPSSWVYVLSQGDNLNFRNEYYYVGVTNRLFTRLNEHQTGKGSLVTNKFKYNILTALYKVEEEEKRRFLEDKITLQLMKISDNPWKIRGGSWTNHGITKFDFKQPKALLDVDLPILCRCEMPAIKFERNGKIFFKCSLDYYNWINNYELAVESTGGCDFFKHITEVRFEKDPNKCLQCTDLCGEREICVPCASKFYKSRKVENYFSNTKIVDEDD
jgi:predicted GIY-YIG superfamily endonuclease